MTVPQNTVNVQGIGAVTADGLNTYVQTISNLAELRNFPGANNMCVGLQGYNSFNDGGQGFYIWSSTAPGPDNGTTVIQPNNTPVGCWLRLALGAGSNLTVTDGVHTVAGVTNLDFIANATVGGATPNATVAVGGAGGLQLATMLLTSADIEALNPTTFTLVPGVAGQYIWPVAAYYQYKFGTTAYVPLGGTTNGAAGLYYSPPLVNNSWLDPGNFGNTTPALGLALVESHNTLLFSPGWSGLLQQLSFATAGASLVIAAPGGGYQVGGDGECLVNVLYTTISSVY